MPLIITPELVHYSSDLERDIEVQLGFIVFLSSLAIRFSKNVSMHIC